MTHGLTVHCSNQLSYFPNIVVSSGGFEPTEAETADLQSTHLTTLETTRLKKIGLEPITS